MTHTTPLYNGLAIFGPAALVTARANPVARATRGLVGTNGLVTQTMGSRGARGEASGALFAVSAVALYALEAIFEAYKLEGQPHILVDSLGLAWPDMILIEFEPISQPYQDVNGFAREYRAEFLGLSVPSFS